jgi:hypothetical protein
MMPNSRALRAAWDSAGDGGGSRRWLAGEAGEGEGERGAGAAADRGEPPAKADNRDEGWELFFYWADGTGMILFRLCSGRCRSATANNASRRAVKSQVKWHSRR